MSSLENGEVGRIFGINHSTASRWRSGERVPGILVMRNIRSVLNWSIDDQADAVDDNIWHVEFEKRLGQNEHVLRATLQPTQAQRDQASFSAAMQAFSDYHPSRDR